MRLAGPSSILFGASDLQAPITSWRRGSHGSIDQIRRAADVGPVIVALAVGAIQFLAAPRLAASVGYTSWETWVWASDQGTGACGWHPLGAGDRRHTLPSP